MEPNELVRVMESPSYLSGNHIRWARQFLNQSYTELSKILKIKENALQEFELYGGMLCLIPVAVENRAKKFFLRSIRKKLKLLEKGNKIRL